MTRTSTPATGRTPSRPPADNAGGGALGLATLGTVAAVFCVVALLRWQEGFSNVDDYLYAAQTQAYLDALPDPGDLVDAWRAHGSNAPAVPTLALPLAAIDSSPHWLVLVQLVPLLVLVGGARSLLGALGLDRRWAWLAAGAIALLAPVLSYAAMYHFGVAAAACTVVAFAAYARSDRLARRRPALVLGLALGALALTRVMAPVYVVAVAVPIAVDVLAGLDRARLANAAIAVVAGAVVAGPWWVVTGETAWDYLVSAGYEESVFTRDASRLEIARERVDWTADESGWLVSALLVSLLAYAAWGVRSRAPGWRLLACMLGACVVGMAFLATTSNAGTAFALPFVVLGACAAVTALRRLRSPLRPAAVAACAAAVAIPLLALVEVVPDASLAGQPLWRGGIPAWEQGRTALFCDDCDLPDTDALNRDVLREIGDRPTLMVRSDAVLNPNGLRHLGPAQISAAPIAGKVRDSDLAPASFVIAGHTAAPYIPPVDPERLKRSLRRDGFRPVLRRHPGPLNAIVVWGR
jgi:hypothetical protein